MHVLPPRLLVFDLDGTLIDSQVDLCNSVNATLAHMQQPVLPDAVITSYVGDGVSALVRRALAHGGSGRITEAMTEEAVSFFLGYYRSHKLDFTYVYPGVRDALKTIRECLPEVLMAVLTNKPVRPSREICSHFGLDEFFFQNYGGNSFETKKPDPTGLIALMSEATLLLRETEPDAAPIAGVDTIMIGDSDVDILTARNGNARSIGCTFGLSPESLLNVRPEMLAQAPSDWPGLLGVG